LLAVGVFFTAAAFVVVALVTLVVLMVLLLALPAALLVDFLVDPVDRVAAAFVVALAIRGAILEKGAG
jgi:hypothetical protein